MNEDLGQAAVRGEVGGGWAVRAERARALFAHLFGEEGPGELARAEDAALHPASRPLGPRRAALETAARSATRALLDRDLEAASAWWAEAPWVLWADGTLGRHPRPLLLAHLRERGGARAPLELRDVRSYDRGEVRASFARGVGAALDFLGPGPWVTVGLEGPRLEIRRLLLVAEADGASFRFTTLGVGAPDEARLVGAPPALHESPEVRLADVFVRARLARRGRGILELRGRLMPRLWLDGAPMEVDQLADSLDAGGAALDAVDAAVESVAPASDREVAGWLGGSRVEAIAGQARSLWHRELADLKPRWASVVHGIYAPAEERLVRRQRTVCLVVRALEKDGTGGRAPRARLAGALTLPA